MKVKVEKSGGVSARGEDKSGGDVVGSLAREIKDGLKGILPYQ